MRTSRCVLSLCALCVLALLSACSNGRGSVEEPTPTDSAQSGFSVGGTAAGVSGSGLVLQNNGGHDLAITTNGGFAFAGLLANGASYNVTVASSGEGQTCTVANGSGSVEGANVTNVTVTCAAAAFAVRGSVTGLTGSGLVLHNNGADPVAISGNGEFAFPQALATGAAYSVSIAAQPSNPSQTCSVTNGSGAISVADVTNVRVSCAAADLTVGGAVSGLLGSGLVLQNNGGDDLAIDAAGPFVFSSGLASGATYNVTVKSQPSAPAQNCTVRNASGTMDRTNVTNIAVSCASNVFTIGGAVSGLSGAGLTLRLAGVGTVDVVTDGAFAFETGVPDGTAYRVSVARQPRNPTQSCTIANAEGVVAGANVGNIAVACTTSTFEVGGSVSGLTASGLVLRLNDAEDLGVVSNGSFTFKTRLSSGSQYRVTIASQPSTQTCTLANASGTLGGSDVANVRVACSSSAFSVGGAVAGLLGSGLVLQNNDGDDLAVGRNGGFTFTRSLANGARYNVTIRTQPSDPAQTCSVARGSGTIDGADVTNVAVSCSTSEFTIGGTVRDLSGSGLVLRNNGADDLTINANGRFTFEVALAAGASYNVVIAAQPHDPAQTCTVTNGGGVVDGRNITNVIVDCATTGFRIRGHVSKLRGSGLVLQNNGGDDLAIASNGRFTFATTLPTGAPYNVTVARQPSDPDQDCTVRDGSGSVGDRDVDDIEVRCRGDDDDDDDD